MPAAPSRNSFCNNHPSCKSHRGRLRPRQQRRGRLCSCAQAAPCRTGGGSPATGTAHRASRRCSGNVRAAAAAAHRSHRFRGTEGGVISQPGQLRFNGGRDPWNRLQAARHRVVRRGDRSHESQRQAGDCRRHPFRRGLRRHGPAERFRHGPLRRDRYVHVATSGACFRRTNQRTDCRCPDWLSSGSNRLRPESGSNYATRFLPVCLPRASATATKACTDTS